MVTFLQRTFTSLVHAHAGRTQSKAQSHSKLRWTRSFVARLCLQALVVVEIMELKSETEDIWLLRHPVWVRWLGWLVLPPLFIVCCYVLLLPVIQNQYEVALIASSLFLGGLPIYMCMQALKTFPYLRSDVEFNSDGFSIYWPDGKSIEYSWSDVLALKHYATASVLELKGKEGKRILAVTDQATSYEQFVEFAVEKTGLKY